MPSLHRRALVLPIAGSLLLLLSSAVRPATAETEAAAAAESMGPVEELYQRRDYDEAVRKADALADAAKANPELLTPENEFYAGRALRALHRYDEARARLETISARWPKHELAADADIDAAVTILSSIDEGAWTAPDRAVAAKAAAALERVADKHGDDPDARARALYIAGNSWRMAQEDARAEAAYQACRGLAAAKETGYPAKCTYGLGTVAFRGFDLDRARTLFTDCAIQTDEERTAQRCGKAVGRLDVVGAPAPPIEARTWLGSDPVSLDELRGKVVMVFFFATWCPHCKAALPHLSEILERFEGKPLELLAVTNNMRGQTTKLVREFITHPEYHIDYPVAIDDAGRTSRAMEATGIPQMVLIDKKGVVRWSDHPVYLRDEMLARLLAE